jgi:hypothetical protein
VREASKTMGYDTLARELSILIVRFPVCKEDKSCKTIFNFQFSL